MKIQFSKTVWYPYILCDPTSYLCGKLSLAVCFVFVGVGAGGEEQEASSVSIFQLPWLAFLVALLFVGTLFCAPTLLALICHCCWIIV